MEGMRRWIGANPTTKTTHGRGTPRGETKRDKVDLEYDPHSTATIACQLMDPSVSEEEEAEYQGCAFCPAPVDDCLTRI
jgi:hypothetical protein